MLTSSKHSAERTPRFARLHSALVLLALLALIARPIHTHGLQTNQSSTGSIDHSYASRFCFECTFGGDHAVFAPETKLLAILESTYRPIEMAAIVTSIALPLRCGRAPPAV